MLNLETDSERFFDNVLQLGDAFGRIHSVQFGKRQRRNRMIVSARHTHVVVNVSIDLRLLIADRHNEAARFLAGGNIFYSSFQSFAVWSTTGRMTVGHESQHT